MAKAKENQFEAVLAPVVEFNKMVVKNAEAVINLQLDSMRTYAELGIKNINAGLEVRNPDDLKAYAAAQKDVADEIAARATADVKAFGELGNKFINEARELAEQNGKAVVAAVPAAKAA